MTQGLLFLCTNCGGDQLKHPHTHATGPPYIRHPCPVCLELILETTDTNKADWVALGQAVCSQTCHARAYELVRDEQHELPL